MQRSYIEAIDRPTVLYVLYSMVSAQQERTVQPSAAISRPDLSRETTPFAFDKRLHYVTDPSGNRLQHHCIQ